MLVVLLLLMPGCELIGNLFDNSDVVGAGEKLLMGGKEQTDEGEAEDDFEFSELIYIGVEELTEDDILEFLANGGQLHYYDYEWIEDPDDELVLRWGGGTDGTWQPNKNPNKNTHRMIADQAAHILANDKGKWAYDALSESITFSGDGLSGRFTGLQLIIEYAWKTDEIDNSSSFAGHFFGENEQNYFGFGPNAYTNFNDRYYNAVREYNNGNKGLAYKELGMAIHYLSDLNAPHHAANKTAATPYSYHMTYESWVDDRVAEGLYRETTAPEETYNYVLNTGTSNDFLAMARNWSALARAQLSNVDKVRMTWTGNLVWDSSTAGVAAEECLKRVQRATAALYYRFLRDTGRLR